MKGTLRFIVLPLLTGVPWLGAQEAASPLRGETSPAPQIAQSSPVPQRAPEILPGLPPLDGPLVSPSPAGPSLEELDALFKQSSLGKAADEARLHVQWRELSNRTVNDPDLVAARSRAETARTDLEKRDRLRSYYRMFFDRMRRKAVSPELQAYLETRKTEHIALLAQSKVRPSPPLPATSATPAATKPRPFTKPPEPELPH